jgi:hypothetical protein
MMDLRHRVRESGPALVEHDDASKASESQEPARQIGMLPVIFDMRDEARYKNEIGRAAAKNLVSDMNIAAFGVVRYGHGHDRPRSSDRIGSR